MSQLTTAYESSSARVFAFGTVAVDAASLVACVWVLCQIQRLGTKKTRLFPRLVRSLAYADCGFHAVHAVMNLGLGTVTDQRIPNYICQLQIYLFLPARTVSLLLELYIATYTMSVVLTSKPMQVLLSRSLPAVWCVGATYGLVASVINPWSHKLSNECLPQHGDPSLLPIMLTCSVLSLLAYVVAMVTSLLSTNPWCVEQRRVRQLAMYSVNFLLTYGVLFYCYLGLAGAGRRTLLLQVGIFMESSNGLLNGLTYLYQSRYSSPEIQDTAAQQQVADGPLASFNVRFCLAVHEIPLKASDCAEV